MGAGRTFWEWVATIFSQNWPMFLNGAGVTLLISLIGTIIGFIIGIIIGIIRTIPVDHKAGLFKRIIFKIVDFIFLAYIEVFRGTPMIVQAMVIYYGASMAFGLRLSAIGAGIFIVSINTGAYMAEIIRGGIISVDKGQFEAAYSVGMNHSQAMVNIVLPQAIRNILPAISNEFVINIKDTSVLNVITVNELFFQSKSIAGNNFRFFEVFFITCAVYFVMTFTITRILRFIERKLDGPSAYQMSAGPIIDAQVPGEE